MDLDNQDKTIIQEEVELFQKTHERIRTALSQKSRELQQDEALAKQLTAEMVAQYREEEKQALSNDEKVAHGLTHLRLKASQTLSELTKQSYFARIVYQEKGRTVEFKLGVGSYPEERIIDWRKGPISKLYYHFEEGEEYDEEIAGVERHGQIRLKRAYRGQYDELSQIEHRDWSLIKHNNTWHKNKKYACEPFSIDDKKKIQELLHQQASLDLTQLPASDGYLAQILALLTPEQFELISKDSTHPMVIQGSAGTGKTTVALHRLAWLLFEGNSTIQAKNTLVMVFHKPLVEYVKNVLPSLGVDDVKITTYFDWAKDLLQTTLKCQLRFARQSAPNSVQHFKSTLATLKDLQAHATANSHLKADDILFTFYKKTALTSTDPDIKSVLLWQQEHRTVDIFDLSLLLHILNITQGHFLSEKFPTRLDHLVIDEAQDFTLPEILALTSFVHDKHQLTFAGDLGQKILGNREFGSWEDLLGHLGFANTEAINLSIAFRSTYQIYQLAEFVRDPQVAAETLKMIPKFGPEPKALRAHNFEEAAHLVKNWIEDQLNINQNLKGAILCRDEDEAKQLFHWLTKQNTAGIRFADVNHFKFTPGIVITAIKNVKGLEFHSVCIFNPSEKNYSVFSAVERNLLYVGLTRALFRLDLIGYEELTSMLPESLEKLDLTLLPDDDDKAPISAFAHDLFDQIPNEAGASILPNAKPDSDDPF